MENFVINNGVLEKYNRNSSMIFSVQLKNNNSK